MEEIQNLEQLRKAVGNDIVNHIFVEYVMECVAKSKRLDEISEIVRRHGSMDEIEAVL